MAGIFDTKIEFVKGVGPEKAKLLAKEINIFTFGDLIQYYPFRYEDRTKVYPINQISEDAENIQIRGKFVRFETIGIGPKQRFVAYFRDHSGEIELLWFKGLKWVQTAFNTHDEYLVFGKPSVFKGKFSIVHPEVEQFTPEVLQRYSAFHPVYSSTELMKKKFVESKFISKTLLQIFTQIDTKIPETLPEYIIQKYKFISKSDALKFIHFPKDANSLAKAKARLKFEELFYVQLKLFSQKQVNKATYKGAIFRSTGLLKDFYSNHLPFPLTNAQKRVLKEIHQDVNSGKQMNRLVQGDVGSGKTIVAFISMLMAVDNGAQACLMAPTEILAEQHYQGLLPFAEKLGLQIALLTGSTKKKQRDIIHAATKDGSLAILIGTHALLEDAVQFHNLSLCIIDEQHRFGVAQRARLWKKNPRLHPHILVMTATPIPRTLAMTLYGDLDVSVIDELPAGRKPIKTVHMYETNRLRIYGLIDEEIKKGRQAYIVFPLIEGSEKVDLKNLMDGYDNVRQQFPNYQLSIVHGKMKPDDKEFEMKRFIKGETKIMIATTVIEVGVNVPNATIMVIENAERFGLAQLHQLRGRVGRGADESICVLASDVKLSKDSKLRIETMVRTNNGFEIADVDLKLRGPGDLGGTKQSGVLDLLIADLGSDAPILQEARFMAERIIEKDPYLQHPLNKPLRSHIDSLQKGAANWGRIS